MARFRRHIAGVCVLLASALLVRAPAGAADMPVKAPPPVAPAAVIFSWTGFYVGGHAGGAWFDKDWFVPNTPINGGGNNFSAGGHKGSSWLAGGQVGFNYQVNQWVFGVEAQFSATKIDGSNVNPAATFLTLNSKTDFIGTIAGRLGVAWDRTLLYVKGGGAWAHDKFFTTAAGTEAQTATVTRWGWMVGVGGEYAFSGNWSVKLEYDYLDLGERRATLQPTAACVGCTAFEYDITQKIHLVKAGINYRFGGPVVARY